MFGLKAHTMLHCLVYLHFGARVVINAAGRALTLNEVVLYFVLHIMLAFHCAIY